MKKYIVIFLFSVLFLGSCASEKHSTSPLTNAMNSTSSSVPKSLQDIYGTTMKDNINASEITNLISSFPKFKNDAVNKEVTKLKLNLQNYLYAYEAYNIAGKQRSLKDFEESYKKLQKLRKFLNPDEDGVLNRYLVRIKTNMGVLESATVNFK